MNKNELKDLVKRYFNLTDIENTTETTEKFAEAHLIDGTKVMNDKDSEFAVGDSLFVETAEGEKVQAPEGEHELEGGIVVVVDAEGVITGIRRPDEAGEGSLEASEEQMSEESEEKTEMAEHPEEGMEPSEEIIEAIAEIVMPEIEALKAELSSCGERMADYEKRMAEHEDKMKEYMSETPASDSKTTAKFSRQSKSIKNSEGPKYNRKRYEMTLAKLSNLKN